MRPALFLIPLLALCACQPPEKPADVATTTEAAAADAAASQATSGLTSGDESSAQ